MTKRKEVKKVTNWQGKADKGNDHLIRLSIQWNVLRKIARRHGLNRRDVMGLVSFYLDSQGSNPFIHEVGEMQGGIKRFITNQQGATALTPEGYQIVLSVIFALRNGLALQKSRRKILT